jgi:hypothetical protein
MAADRTTAVGRLPSVFQVATLKITRLDQRMGSANAHPRHLAMPSLSALGWFINTSSSFQP